MLEYDKTDPLRIENPNPRSLPKIEPRPKPNQFLSFSLEDKEMQTKKWFKPTILTGDLHLILSIDPDLEYIPKILANDLDPTIWIQRS